MDQLPAFGRSVQDIAARTFKTYTPLLLANAGRIRSVRKETFAYGEDARQNLDVYFSEKPKLFGGRQAVLVFLYGGGLVLGDRTLQVADGLVHANVASFFALHYGYTVVVLDYRRVQDGARFPSGGEDVALAVDWISRDDKGVLGSDAIDLFIMGNSAGGIHLSTFLLHPDFESARRQVLSGSKTRLRGVIMLSVPFHFDLAEESRHETLRTYFGDWEKNSPFGQLSALRKLERGADFLNAGTRVLVLNGELDPADELLRPREDFVREWLMLGIEGVNGLSLDLMKGHNHLSPVVSLGTGDDREEAWGHQVAAFSETIRKFSPSDK